MQDQCQECTLQAEFDASTLHYSQVIDQLCEKENKTFTEEVTEQVTDTIRTVAVQTDSSLYAVAIVMLVVAPLLTMAIIAAIITVCCFRYRQMVCWAPPKPDKPDKLKETEVKKVA